MTSSNSWIKPADHDLRRRVTTHPLPEARRLGDRPHLQNRPGSTSPSRTPRRPSIGFCSCRRLSGLQQAEFQCLPLRLGERNPHGQLGHVGPGLRAAADRSPEMIGRPSIASRMRMKSLRCNGRRASSATSDPRRPRRGSGARRRSCAHRGTCCSVRTSRCPGLPSGARGSASSGVSAFARTRRRHAASACDMIRSTARWPPVVA